MLLMIDNYDSFTYNLVQYFGSLKAPPKVWRNDKITLKKIRSLKPDQIVISPGPCTPSEAGISVEVIQEFSGKIPILGVCLGHQSIGQAFGGNVIRASQIMHGKTSDIYHDNNDLFKGMPMPFVATRYHSLLVEKKSLPKCLKITAKTKKGEIMGMKHESHPTWGVQFHPESILTQQGMKLLNNFLLLSRSYKKRS
jgi:anthranilate synthase component 2